MCLFLLKSAHPPEHRLNKAKSSAKPTFPRRRGQNFGGTSSLRPGASGRAAAAPRTGGLTPSGAGARPRRPPPPRGPEAQDPRPLRVRSGSHAALERAAPGPDVPGTSAEGRPRPTRGACRGLGHPTGDSEAASPTAQPASHSPFRRHSCGASWI